MNVHAEPANCLDTVELAEMLEGCVGQAERSRRAAHLAGCEACREEIAAISQILADADVAQEINRIGPVARVRTAPHRWMTAGALAAAVALLAIAGPALRGRRDSPHRAPTITAAPAPVLAFPVGPVERASALAWGRVTGADRYRVTLFDAAGLPLFEAQTADTTVTIPDSVVLAPSGKYLWQVEARTSADRWSASRMEGFTIHDRSR